MAISGFFNSRKLLNRNRLEKRNSVRRVLLETLEPRQLMAVGPQLIGVQPNSGSLLEGGEILQTSPTELIFRFDDSVGLDPNTLSGIKIVRADADGLFERAAVATDFGTNGETLVEFYSREVGEAGNGITLNFTRVSRTDTRLPKVTVDGRTLTVELNSNPQLQTRVQDLLQVFSYEANSAASQMVYALRLRGSDTVGVAQTVDVNRTYVLTGAGAAKGSTNFGLGNNVSVQFLAKESGNAGLGLRIHVTSRDRGGVGLPVVNVSGNTINVELNSNSRYATSIQEFINAINSSSAASSLIEARLVSGSGAIRIGGQAITYSPIILGGISESEIVPGYIGFGDTDREVILRFAERLPQGQYRIDILGHGARALLNADGEVFNDGVSASIVFGLNLGARIESVVPQPVFRAANGTLTQQRNQIDIYFNEDALVDVNSIATVNGQTVAALSQLRTPFYLQSSDTIVLKSGGAFVPSVLNVNFYQLIHTAETLNSQDDVRLVPNAVRYYPDADRVSLVYANNLDELRHPSTGALLPAADLRLRVGTNETTPQPPAAVNALASDPGSAFTSALNLSGSWSPGASGTQSVLIDAEIKNTTPLLLDFPGGSDEPGNRQNRYQDNLRLEADEIDGTSVLYYNFQGLLGQIGSNNLVNAITEQQKQRVREVFSLYEQYLGVRFVESASKGMTIAVGDHRAVTPFSEVVGDQNPGIVELNARGGTYYEAGTLSNGQPGAVLDIQDFSDATLNAFGGPFQRAAMQAVGRLLGLGLADEVEGFSVMAFDSAFAPGVGTDIVLPGEVDIVHGQYLYRPDSKDIDLYQFSLPVAGRISIETFAERMSEASLLDTTIRLYQQNSQGGWDEIAANDDYYSSDSFVQLDLEQGNYIVGVSAGGNDTYDPVIGDSGIGGLSQGRYQLRMDFRPPAQAVLRDSTGLAIDGDSDGVAGGVFNFWFRPAGPNNTIFVDKTVVGNGNGTLASPYKHIRLALAEAQPGDVVRIVGNGGADGSLATVGDNLAYEIGFNNLGQPLPDGSTFDVPKDVSVMIDAGAVLKMRRSRIGVGSTSTNVDRSGGSLLVLGTPKLVDSAGAVLRDANGDAVSGTVYFTSAGDATIGKSANQAVVGSTPAPGDWGGIDFRNRVDASTAGRINDEAEGQFLNWISHADVKFGGGQVVIDGISQVVTPVQMIDARPSVSNSTISRSADAAMSASPNSFLESNFHSPSEQFGSSTAFTVDYDRVGPSIRYNHVVNNSINGLQVRIRTAGGSQLETMSIPGRFDDTDIVHYLPENLVIAGTPGGVKLVDEPPNSIGVRLQNVAGGTLFGGVDYTYVFTRVVNGVESAPSEPTTPSRITDPAKRTIALSNLPIGVNRIYRSSNGEQGPYVLVAEFTGSNPSVFNDTGSNLGTTLVASPSRFQARLDGSLTIDPGTIVKTQGSLVEVSMGGQLIAEGKDGYPVVFTSLLDHRYGAGGTFQTAVRNQTVSEGNWAGIYVGHTSKASLDHVVLAYGGGTARVEGGFADFNAVEVHQGNLRIANSRLEFNDGGAETATDPLRAGRGWNSPGVIFVRGSQPILVDNLILDNLAPAISASVGSLNFEVVQDSGRSRGRLDRVASTNNHGPLVSGNRLANNSINGMVVRGGVLTVEGVWDDTDIVHVIQDEIVVSDHNHYSGLRLTSQPGESLVIKLSGENAGFTATGMPLDNADRIGGSVQLLGLPNYPVILTSLADNSVGAGFTPTGEVQLNTIPSAESLADVVLPTNPNVNQGTLIDNNVTQNVPGFFSFDVGPGGRSDFLGNGGITAQGNTRLLVNSNVVFAFSNYIDVGSDGQAFDLGGTTITTPPTLIAPDFVISEGTFAGQTGNVNWRVETWMENGIARVNNRLILTSAGTLGDIRVINYLDEDIEGVDDDLMYILGTPGESDFRVFTLDGPERVGFSHGGTYEAAEGLLENATYVGWAADAFPLLETAITTTGTTYTLPGNINTGNLVPFYDSQLGDVYGLADITTAFAWNVDAASNRSVVSTFLDLVARNPVSAASPGDWRSVLVETHSNDRNVPILVENEFFSSTSTGTNNSTLSPQYLGAIAPSEKAGDENMRLGFHVMGSIATPSDVDVYSFWGNAGTEVWLDIDRTDNSLDTVIELVDADGRILALSSNSLEEEADPSRLYRSPDMPEFSVNPLRKSAKEFYYTSAQGVPKDLYSTNPRDAGMRVVLPGAIGSSNLYHIRVRSSNLKDGDPVTNLLLPQSIGAGLTKGSYTLQVRLRETDEVPGSGVNYAEIRYAQTGLDLRGVPGNSPLLGETGEVEIFADGSENDTFPNAQPIGNVLKTSRQALSVAGNLDDISDVDWFAFEIEYERITPTALREYFSTVFDLDYSDGIGRPETSMYLYNANGALILSGLGSGLVDDQAGALTGADSSELSQGSFGTGDPYIGSFELPAGTYFLAVTNARMVPEVMDQFTNPDSTSGLVRLLPMHGNQLIAEDRVSGPPVLFSPTESVVPYELTDMVLYVSQNVGRLNGEEQTNVYIVNPFTGEIRNRFGRIVGDIQDIAMRDNGLIQAFDQTDSAIVPGNGDRDGFLTYYTIDPHTEVVTAEDIDLQTFHTDPDDGNVVDSNDGWNPEALAFARLGGQERGFMVTNRAFLRPGLTDRTNVIFEFNPTTGQPFSTDGDPDFRKEDPANGVGVGTDIIERGRIETFTLDGIGQPITQATRLAAVSGAQIADGDRFVLIDGSNVQTTFEFDLNGSVSGGVAIAFFPTDSAETIAIRVNQAINSSGVPGISSTLSGNIVQLIGARVFNDGPLFSYGIAPGGLITGATVISNPVIGNKMFAVSDAGGLYVVTDPHIPTIVGAGTAGDVGSYVTNSYALTGIEFTALAAGPTNVLNGQQILFGLDRTGRIHAFDTDGRLQPIFANGATSVATGLTSANGLAFSTLDANLWHVTNNRSADDGHGIERASNDSNTRVNGGNSFYFGLEDTTKPNHMTYNFPGGASGAIESLPFNLAGITAGDLPTFYFNYFLETEGAASNLATGSDAEDYMRDSFRVYVSGEDGQWTLVATNNDTSLGNGLFDDELDAEVSGNPEVQRLFDNTGAWRQARVPLNLFAGQQNVKIRIEFATAGGFGYGLQGGRGPEIRTIAANRLSDGETVLINGQAFEIEMGAVLTLPSGQGIRNGDSVTIDGTSYVFTTDLSSVVSPDIGVIFNGSMTAEQIAQALRQAILDNPPASSTSPTTNSYTHEANDTITTAEASGATGGSIRIVGNGFIGDNPGLVDPSRDVDMVRVDVQRGATITARVQAASGSALDSYVRVFDSFGNQLASNDNDGGTFDSLVTFVAPEDGTYFIGVSSSGNANYNPAIAGSGTVGSSLGAYTLTIDVARLLAPIVDGNRLQMTGAADVQVSVGSNLVLNGGLGTTGIPVYVTLDMTAGQVAAALQQAVANHFANRVTSAYPIRGGDTLSLTGLTVGDSGPFGLTTSFVGDQFGAYNEGTNFDGTTNNLNPGSLQGRNNAFEGVYVDDFVIGLAGRGEVVQWPDYTAPGNTNFVVDPQLGATNPERGLNSILVGPYQFEIRGGEDIGVPGVGDITYTQSFANHSRMTEGLSIQFNPGATLSAGATFTVTDGTRVVVFELDDTNDNATVGAGHIALPFNSSESAQIVAARFRDILNSPTVQSLLQGVSANLLNNDRLGATSDTVVLVGQVDVVVPTAVGERVVSQAKGVANRERLQGQVVINSARISNSLTYGVNITTGPRDAITNAPVSGTPRNTVTINDERLTPGAVVVNSEFMFNRAGGINIEGDAGGPGLPSAAVPFARLVNNTIVGGFVDTIREVVPTLHGGFLFELGNFAFADRVVTYNPFFGSGPGPGAGLNEPNAALGAPNFNGSGEPLPFEGAVSLGRGGQLTLQFTNNVLTGSGDASPDLVVFEVGESEQVLVEVSTDGNSWTSVGVASGNSPTIDVDAYGFNQNSRLYFVRLTDVANDGSTSGISVGADIDAVGALSSVAADRYAPGGIGISVTSNATATLMNNVLVNNAQGIQVDASSASTVIGGSVFQRNSANVSGVATTGQFPVIVGENTQLFVSPGSGNLYPSPGSPLIDRSIDSLQDRASLVAVKRPLGYTASPILAPQWDVAGQLRVDDPTVDTAAGQGELVFKDRGASERADFVGPTVILEYPADNDAAGLDRNPEASIVELINLTPQYFDIRLVDGLEPSDPNPGSGIDHSTVTSSSVLVYRNGEPLAEGVDYRFGYDSTNGVIRLQSLAGIWRGQSVYTIRLLTARESTVVARPTSSYNDGDKFEIIDAMGDSTLFEFDLGYLVRIPSLNETDAVDLDGRTFTIDDGSRRITFEFDGDGEFIADNTTINVRGVTSLEAVTQAMVATIQAAGLQVSTEMIRAGLIQIHGSLVTQVDPLASGLVVSGQPGVQPAFGLQIPLLAGVPNGVADGQTFVIDRGDIATTFEIDTNGTILPGNVAVRVPSSATAAQVGAALVAAINEANLGLTAAYAGNGIVTLGGDANTQLNLTNTVLTQIGLPGKPAARAIPLPAGAKATQVAELIRQALETANLEGVTITSFGNRLLLEGAQGASGVGAGLGTAIRDLAGNPLKPNQVDGTTTLTVFLGEGYDYGDAGAPYVALANSNGPRHKVVSGLSLGATVTADVDARVNDLDQDDGVTFNAAYAAFQSNVQLSVTNSTGSQAYASLWIDFDGDGFFSSTELIADAIAVSSGTTTVSFLIPADAVRGTVFARARLSSDRDAVRSPVGIAPDGEVEDWALNIQTNPYTNGNWNLDVNASGHVSPIDALQIINWLNDPTKPRDLTLEQATFAPPYVDVNGDGRVSALDALMVINHLNTRSSSNGNNSGLGGEGEGEGEAFIPSAGPSDMGNLFSQQAVLPGDWMGELMTAPKRSNLDSSETVSIESVHDFVLTSVVSEDEVPPTNDHYPITSGDLVSLVASPSRNVSSLKGELLEKLLDDLTSGR